MVEAQLHYTFDLPKSGTWVWTAESLLTLLPTAVLAATRSDF